MKKQPLILISNDDGYESGGIRQLIGMVRPLGDVMVVAPDSARSGASMAVTSSLPVRLRKVSEEDGLTVYACSGTPCDCVKLAFEAVLPRRPDIVLSGINHGENAAVNAHYSGTVAVCNEGTLKGVPSIAFSSQRTKRNADFSALTPYVQDLVRHVMDDGLPPYVCLNVNFPDSDVFAGIRACRMGHGDWVNEWERRIDPHGHSYFWLTGEFDCTCDHSETSTDTWALRHNFVAITPLQIDITDTEYMGTLQRWLAGATKGQRR